MSNINSIFTITAQAVAIYVPHKNASIKRLQEVCNWFKMKGGRKITDTTYFFDSEPPSILDFQHKFSPLEMEEGYAWFDGKGTKPQLHVIAGKPQAIDVKITISSVEIISKPQEG